MNIEKQTDKYFQRMHHILQCEGLNPWVNYQVFARKGEVLEGVREAVELIKDHSPRAIIYGKKDGSLYLPGETVMNILAPVLDVCMLETLYLGILSGRTSEREYRYIDFKQMSKDMKHIKTLAGERKVYYFGARHFHPDLDRYISSIAWSAGLDGVSTDNGAGVLKKEGVGTIPHALESVMAYEHGRTKAVVESLKAFDKHIQPGVPRTALVDYNNEELTDTWRCAQEMGDRLSGVRIDTCGENLAQGTDRFCCDEDVRGFAKQSCLKYWYGRGVSISAVLSLRAALNDYTPSLEILLSSGFSNPEKVEAFNQAELRLDTRFYDAIGAGFAEDQITFTSDIVAVGDRKTDVDFYSGEPKTRNLVHKMGRGPSLNHSLEKLT